eukprot:1568561-Pyramimonas_sp.AAC.1
MMFDPLLDQSEKEALAKMSIARDGGTSPRAMMPARHREQDLEESDATVPLASAAHRNRAPLASHRLRRRGSN